MGSGETRQETAAAPRIAMQERINEIRKASFESSRKGYDKAQVRRYLDAVADWLEGLGLGDADRGEMRRELAWVGERTAEILTKAEETATELREQAETASRRMRSEAEGDAERMRTEAEAEARRMRDEAAAEAKETIAAAERKAESIVSEANRRRQDLHSLIGDLLVRRDEIVADGVRLAEELAELFATSVELPGEDEQAAEAEPEATSRPGGRFDPAALDDEGDTYDEDGIRIPRDDVAPIRRDPDETVESDALAEVDEPDTEEQASRRK